MNERSAVGKKKSLLQRDIVTNGEGCNSVAVLRMYFKGEMYVIRLDIAGFGHKATAFARGAIEAKSIVAGQRYERPVMQNGEVWGWRTRACAERRWSPAVDPERRPGSGAG